jgi:hypothetical protein
MRPSWIMGAGNGYVFAAETNDSNRCWYQDPPGERFGGLHEKGACSGPGKGAYETCVKEDMEVAIEEVDGAATSSSAKYSHRKTFVVVVNR